MPGLIQSGRALLYAIPIILVVWMIDTLVMTILVWPMMDPGWLKTVLQFGTYFLYLVAVIGVPLLMATQEG